MGLSDLSLLNDAVTQHIVGKIKENGDKSSSATSRSFHRKYFCLFVLINVSGEVAIHAPFELQTHHKATVYFAMKFNNLAAYY